MGQIIGKSLTESGLVYGGKVNSTNKYVSDILPFCLVIFKARLNFFHRNANTPSNCQCFRNIMMRQWPVVLFMYINGSEALNYHDYDE